MFVSAFPKSLHCTDEAQQAETVLSAVLSIYIDLYIYEPVHEKKGVTYGRTVLRYGHFKSADRSGRSSPKLCPC